MSNLRFSKVRPWVVNKLLKIMVEKYPPKGKVVEFPKTMCKGKDLCEIDRTMLSWDDLSGTEEIFSVWVDGDEIEWAKKSWEILSAHGLTEYENEIERCLVLIRLLCLGVMYREFCYFAWDEYPDIDLADWADEAGINSFRIAQIVGNEFEPDLDGSERELLEEALKRLILREHSRVYRALVEGFGGKSMLFASLWLTMEKGAMADGWDDEEGEENEDDHYEQNSFSFSLLDGEEEENEHDLTYEDRLKNESVLRSVLNDVDANKLRAYAWVEEGMPIEVTF